MKYKRAIGLGVLAYVASFMLGLIIAAAIGLDFSSAVEAPPAVWYLGIIATVIVMAFFTYWYFRDTKITRNYKEGLYFGLVAIGVGFVIDAVLIIPYILTTDAPQSPLAYYTNPLFWLTLVILLGTTTLIGYLLGKKKA